MAVAACEKAVKHITAAATARMPGATSSSTEFDDSFDDYEYTGSDGSVGDGIVEDGGSEDHGIPT